MCVYVCVCVHVSVKVHVNLLQVESLLYQLTWTVNAS